MAMAMAMAGTEARRWSLSYRAGPTWAFPDLATEGRHHALTSRNAAWHPTVAYCFLARLPGHPQPAIQGCNIGRISAWAAGKNGVLSARPHIRREDLGLLPDSISLV